MCVKLKSERDVWLVKRRVAFKSKRDVHQPPLGLEQTTKLERQVQLHVWGLVGRRQPEWATLGLEQTSELERQLQLQLWGLVGRRQPEWWRKVTTNLPPWRQPLGL